MTATATTYRPVLPILVGDRPLPEGCDAWAIRTVYADLTSSRGFRWPWPGQWAQAPGPIIEANTGACPDAVGDGLCVAVDYAGMASGGVPARTLLLCAYSTGDVLGTDGSKLRVRRAFVVDVLDGERIARANLGGANLRNANLWGANLWGAYLRGANLGDADLRGANLRNANLWGAYLGGAYLREADLGGANLEGAYLRNADLQYANLGNANLWGAYLRGANLGDADLRGANLWGANLWGARYSTSTTWPDGFDPAGSGAVLT